MIQHDAEHIKQDDGTQLLQALFAPGDTISIRPVEAWIEGGQKRSRVDYKGVCHLSCSMKDGAGQWQWIPPASPISLDSRLQQIATRSEKERTNTFFGVCPRSGAKGQYEQAWQIRVVRTLWCDIDNTASAEEALERCKAAGLPRPSLVVSSGNGVHLYWLLAEPYLIDDAGGDPPAVYTEFVDQGPDRKKKPRKYLVDSATKERLYLDSRQNIPSLSTKAQFVQDINAGIASKIGGDHTQDISRILRVPGTLNRKDERNGKPPKPCTLVSCDATLRYPIEQFEPFAVVSPQKARREQVAKVKLPSPRKLSAKATDTFHSAVLACDTAAVGSRSEADYALCCWAVEHGMAREAVWSEVQNVGKFRDDDTYFNRTWSAAENHTQETILSKVSANNTEQHDDYSSSGTGGLCSKDDIIRGLADQICEDHKFAQDAGGRLFHFADGVYKAIGAELVKRQVKRFCIEYGKTEEWSPGLATDVVEYIRVDAPVLWDRPPLDLLNVKNGLLRIADRVLLPHSANHLSPTQLPVAYDPSATCPAIEAFVNQTFPDDATVLAWEIVALLMLPNTSIQKAVLLLGPGGNGKSVYLRVVTVFLGKENTSGLPLHKLEADKFAASRLYGKLANICPDLPSEHLAGTSTFKAITGGDVLTGEYKFRDSFDFVPYARLVFSANNAPRSQDSSQGFFDRWVVIPFERSFRGTDAEIQSAVLDARLQAPSELSGLLNKALDALTRIDGKCGFTMPDSVQKAWREFWSTTDPLAVWLDRYTVDDPNTYVVKRVLRVAFNGHMERQGRPAMTETAFGLALSKHRPSVASKQRTVGGRMQWCYVGIGILEPESNPTRHNEDNGVNGVPLSVTNASERMSERDDVNSPGNNRWTNPVNPVSPVSKDGDCQHTWQDTQDGEDWIKTACSKCGKFRGRRPVEQP